MAVRSTRLGNGSAIALADHLVFTVPADRTAIVKQLTVHNTGLVAQTFAFYVDPVVGATYAIEESVGLGAARIASFNTRFHVLREGDELRLSGTAPANWSASGALLLGDPS